MITIIIYVVNPAKLRLQYVDKYLNLLMIYAACTHENNYGLFMNGDRAQTQLAAHNAVIQTSNKLIVCWRIQYY